MVKPPLLVTLPPPLAVIAVISVNCVVVIPFGKPSAVVKLISSP